MNKARRKKLADIRSLIEEAMGNLADLVDEEREAFEALPDSLKQGERGQAMESAADAMDAVHSSLDDALGDLDGVED